MDEYELQVTIDGSDTYLNNEGEIMSSSSIIYVNGELIDSNGNHMEAILRHLGYNAVVNYD